MTLLIVLFFSISSVSSQSLNDLDDNATSNKVIKSSSLSTKTTTLSVTNKVKSNATTKVKSNTRKKTNNNATKTSTNKTKEAKTTVNKKTLAKTSTNFMSYVEKNGKFPKVKISNKNYSNTEYLYLMTKAVENDSDSKIEINKNLVKKYSNTNHKSVKGSLNKTEYVKIAGKTRKFIEKNKRAPNWVSSSKGNIPYNQLILSYSKCLDFYNKNNRLPNSIRLDDLDLDKISSKINANKSKSTNSTVNSTKKTANTSIKANTTKKTTKTNTNTSKKTTNTSKNKASTTKETKNTPSNADSNNGENGSNTSLVEMTLNNIHSILNNILDRLDPSKYKVDVTKSDEANVKLNTRKINVDVNGKSTVNVKVSAKNTTKKTTKAKTTTNRIKETATKVKTTTNAIKKTVIKNTTKTSINSTKKNTTKTNGTKTSKAVSKANSKTAKLNDTSIAKELKKYLSSSRNCQISNKEIKELSQKLTSTLKSDYDKGKKLFQWVRDNVQYKKYRNTRRGAVKTLKAKKGNCVDQSHLLIALSRASGIPARYVKGDKCRFTTGYVSGHIWTEILVGNKWIVADPTSSRNTFGKIRNWNTKNYVLCGKYSSISF